MRAWKRSRWCRTLSLFLVASTAAGMGCGGGGGGDDRVAPGGSGRTALTGGPPSAPPAPAVNEQQGSFADPPTNAGAYVQQIPIEVPAGIGAMTPDISLAYSSHGGLGAAGVGWDIPMAMITLNQADGLRPLTVEDDIMRYPVGTPVERYASNFGTIAELRQAGPYPTAPKSYLFTAHSDAQIDPIRDEPPAHAEEYNGEKAAWQVTTKDGTKYRYGYLDDASLWRDEGATTKSKVAWMLDQVEDTHGNRMHYYYEEYPAGQDTFRQPALRAIEYGVPASDQATPERMVVLFDYLESPWKKRSYSLGTMTDFAFVLNRICVFANASVVAGTTPGGHRKWTIPNSNAPAPSDNNGFTKTGCWELTYQFEDDAYPDGYTGRPLLMKVQRVAHDGSRLPPWSFNYRHQSTNWRLVYPMSINAGGAEWNVPDEVSLERSTLDVEQQMVDLNGDALVDILEGNSNGTMAVSLARPEAAGGLTYEPPQTWDHPLAEHATPVDLTVTMLEDDKDSKDSDIWHHFSAIVGWEVGAGLGYAQPLTGAPDPFSEIFLDHNPGGDGEWDESEDEHRTLGMFQFLHSAFVGPPPSIGMRNLVDRADTIDQLETFGSFKDKVENEAGFDSRISDGQDAGDKVELDHCFNTRSGPIAGALGADLDCFDLAAGRWFAAAHAIDGKERGYAAETWAQQDMDGDGLVDLVFAAPVVVRDESGVARDFGGGANDWFWSPGTGSGFRKPRPWIVPSKSPGLLEVGMVHGTPMMGVSVSDNELQANRTYGGGLVLSVGLTGWSVAPTAILPGGAIGLPSYSAGFDGGFDLQSFAIGAGVSAGFQTAAYAGVSQRALSAAALSLRAVSAMQDPLAGFPDVGFGMNITNKGPQAIFDLPYLGRLTIKPLNDPMLTRSYGYQGMMDVTGDGRPDLVTSRFETPLGGLNPAAQWLLYRNNGDGFEEPEVMRFLTTPATGAAGPLGTTITSMSRTTTRHYTDSLSWVPGGWDEAPIGILEQDWGLADLNGDGYPDLVDSTPQYCDGSSELCWTVYFNLGREFSEPIEWSFQGNWQTQHGGDCNGVLAFPSLMRAAYGQVVAGSDSDPRRVESRQVQGLADANGDGLMDFVYEKPAPVDGANSQCDYINPDSNFQSETDIGARVSPYRLNRELLVRLSTGHGFGPPLVWSSSNGYALGGAVVVGGRTQDPPHSAVSHAAVGAGDFDGDGAPDLSVRLDADWFEDGDDFELSRLYKLGEANVDVLESATAPDGGRIEVAYSYQKPSPHLAGGHWTVSSVRTVDLDDTRLDVTRHYYYEGGKYDRAHRTFQGFERVYQVSESASGYESSGYTLSRYYQSPGFEGQLYCHAVRRVADAKSAVEELVAEHRAEWDDTPLGGARPGWTAPVAIGDAEHATALAGPLGLPGDAADLAGGDEPPEGGGSYGPPPTGTPADDPAEEAEEEDRDETDEATPHEPADPVWPSNTPADASGAAETMPRDVIIPGTVIDWRPENDAGQPVWWDLPLYDDDCDPGVTGAAVFVCDPDDVALPELACGDADDPGALVEEQFSVLGDLSGLTDVHTIRPVVASTRLYDAAGGNPRIVAADNEYDRFGDVTTARDLGDITTADDDLVTTTEFTRRGGYLELLGKPCHTTVQDASGQTLQETRHAYDGAGTFGCGTAALIGDLTSVQRRVDAGRTVTEGYHYTAEGLVDTHTDPRLHVTTTTYDVLHPWFPVREERTVVNASGPTVIATETRWLGINKASITHFGVVGEEVDPNGDVTTHVYDSFNRPLKLVRPGNTIGAPTESWSYHDWDTTPNDRSRVAHTRRFNPSLSVTTTTTVDGFGQVAKEESPPPDNLSGCGVGCVAVGKEVVYDAEGRVIESHQPYFSNSAEAPGAVATTYDLLGRITQVVGPNDAATTTAYDRDLTTVTDPDGLVVVTRNDARDRPIGVYRYADSGASLYSAIESSYRADGALEGMLDDAGNQWSFEYDQLGRQISANDPNTGVRSVIYDDSGNTAVVTDGRYATIGLAMATAYDALDRPLVREVRRNTTVSGTTLSGGIPTERTFYWYDVDPATFPGAALACAFNNRGHLSRVVQWLDLGGVMTEVSRKEYCYDDRGRVEKMAHVIGGQTYAFAYEYNSADQLVKQWYPDGDIVTTEYDAAGRVVRTRNNGGPLLAASHARADGQPVRRELGNGAAKQRFCYEDGAAGAILSRMVVGSPAMTFGCANTPSPIANAIYDVSYERTAAGRITDRHETFVRPGTGVENHDASYGYDGVFRLESETYDGTPSSFDYDTLDNLTEIGGAVQSFGATGRAVRGAGPNALLAGAGGRTFGYDAIGNALSMTSGGTTSGFVRAFDGQPLTITRGANVNDWSIYYYDESGHRVMSARGGVGKIYAGLFNDDGTRTESFYPGIGVKAGGAQYFTVRDPAGSTALVLDATGNAVQYTAYEPYGGLRANDAFDPAPADGITPYKTDYLFGGKERDRTFAPADDIYDHGPRMYFADVGTWLTADPTYADGPNRYTFVHGDPINYADPTGFHADGHHLFPKEFWRRGNKYGWRFPEEVRKLLDQFATGPLVGRSTKLDPYGHGWNKLHVAFNQAVGELFANAMNNRSLPPPHKWETKHAYQMLNLISESADPRIIKFMVQIASQIDDVAGPAGKLSKRFLARGLTAVKWGGRYAGPVVKIISAGLALRLVVEGKYTEAYNSITVPGLEILDAGGPWADCNAECEPAYKFIEENSSEVVVWPN